MKIAVASVDGTSISPHFGRSRCFVVFEFADSAIVAREVRDNTYTAHAQGQCDGQHEHHHDQPHSHASMVEALRDCQVVLCGGMGWRAAQELQANGIVPITVDPGLAAEQAALDYAAGKFKTGVGFCRCRE